MAIEDVFYGKEVEDRLKAINIKLFEKYNTKKLDIKQFMLDNNYTDIVGNLPFNQLQGQLKTIYGYKPDIKEFVIYVNNGKADIYISHKDFDN